MSVSRTGRRTPSPTHSASVRPILLDAAGLTLSGLLAQPPGGRPPKATLVAVHGGGMRAGYFDGQAHPDLSLLTLGAALGFTVLALDRPGYGHSATALPDGATLNEQADVLLAALDTFADQHAVGAGFALLAHSYGGKLALVTAAHAPGRLLAVDASGVGHRYAIAPVQRQRLRRHLEWERNWGPLGLYPTGTFRATEPLVAPIPAREAAEIPRWPDTFDTIAERITVPLRLTFAEHEAWWLTQDTHLADMTARLTATDVLRVERQPGTGHNISLSHAARSYHLRALAFLEERLHTDSADSSAPGTQPGQQSAGQPGGQSAGQPAGAATH